MYICNSSVALKVAHITDLCNHACRILDDRQRLKTCQYYGFLQPTGLELGFGEIHTLIYLCIGSWFREYSRSESKLGFKYLTTLVPKKNTKIK